jgi:hypothetical protein
MQTLDRKDAKPDANSRRALRASDHHSAAGLRANRLDDFKGSPSITFDYLARELFVFLVIGAPPAPSRANTVVPAPTGPYVVFRDPAVRLHHYLPRLSFEPTRQLHLRLLHRYRLGPRHPAGVGRRLVPPSK